MIRNATKRLRPVLRSAIVMIGLLLVVTVTTAAAEPEVRLLRTPNQGIQPQAVVDARGVVYLIDYKGDAAAGDVYYMRSDDGGVTFSKPMRVNSRPGSAVAMGTIRGPHMALGRNGRVHVSWNGSATTAPPGDQTHFATPMFYSRINDTRTAFEPQRNLMTETGALDGGGSVAANSAGNVYVVWHGLHQGEPTGEKHRGVWIARSSDDGETFSPERRADDQAMGACGCCGMAAAVDREGRLLLMYRTAPRIDERDMRLLVSRDHGRTFHGMPIDPWKSAQCPMSTSAISLGRTHTWIAWETEQHVYMRRINPVDLDGPPHEVRIAAPSRRNAKHPSLAVNDQGQVLLVWTEGTGWNRGGAVAWQVYDADGKPIAGCSGRVDGLPVWSYATAFARPGHSFAIVY